ncbi:MAG: thiol peroxidase [Flavobacteriales bacterium AspAUS03]
MANILFKGNEVHISGVFLQLGDIAPDFELVKVDLSRSKLTDFRGHQVILNIFPSIDTGVCAASVRRFNQEAASLDRTVVLCISKDLPFAQSRFCGAEDIDRVVMLSDFRCGGIGQAYGVKITDGPLCGLLARAVVVIDERGKVIHTELVREITQEPDYQAALAKLKGYIPVV